MGNSIYVWGVIGYTDFSNKPLTNFFCKQIPPKEAYAKPPGFSPGSGAFFLRPLDCPGMEIAH